MSSTVPPGHKLARITVGQRIESDLRRRIREGQWSPGKPLPSRRDLAREYGVDLRTVQKAIAGLLMDHTLRADGARGTFMGPEALKALDAGSEIKAPSCQIGTVGVLIESAIEGSGTRVPPGLHSLEAAINQRGGICRVLDLKHPDHGGLPLEDGICLLQAQGAEGIVSLLDTSPDVVEPLLNRAHDKQVPIVHAGGALAHTYRLSVTYSSADASFRAASHLLRRGCKTLLVFSAYSAEWVRQRISGAYEAADVHGLPRNTVLTSIGELEIYTLFDGPNVQQIQVDGAYESALDLLQRRAPADGIIAVNDHNAYGFMRAANEFGLTAGKDYAIVGFDDARESAALGLTTIRPPYRQIAEESVAMLIHEIANPGSSLPLRLPVELITRASTMSFNSKSRTASASSDSSVR